MIGTGSMLHSSVISRTKGLNFCLCRVYLILWIIQCQLFVTDCQDNNPPVVFTQEPLAGSIANEGSTKILTCRASSYPSAEYQWLRDGVLIPRETMTTLRLEVKRTDAGLYRCVAKNYLGSILSNGCDIKVAYLEQFANTSGETIHVDQGEAVVINVPPIDSVPPPSITWYLGASFLNSEGTRHQVSLQNSLVFLETLISQDGSIYKAHALNSLGQTSTSQEFTLRVAAVGDSTSVLSPQIIVPPVDTSVRQGETKVEFECIVNARPIIYLDISWFRINSAGRTQIISVQGTYIISTFKRQLLIKNPGPDDEGMYECVAELVNLNLGRTYPSVSARANLTVIVGPMITSHMANKYTKDFSQSFELPCLADGTPTPTIHWYHNIQEIPTAGTKRYVKADGTLHISGLELSDAGVYQCFARNTAGETKKATYLKVNSSPPELATRPANLSVVEGHAARFPCDARGAPKPDVVWTRITENGEETLATGGGVTILEVELLLASTVTADTGLYICNATNSRGSVSAEAYLTVLVRTQIVRPPQDISAIKGSSPMLHCGVSHDPDVLVTWTWSLDNIQIIPDTRRVISSEGSLTILGVYGVDIGTYLCQVTSNGGNDSRTARLTVIDKPKKMLITSVKLHPTQIRSVNLTWNPNFPDGNSPILKFIIQYREVKPGQTLTPDADWITYQLPGDQDVGPDQQFHIVTGLQPATSYQFRISAVNAVGEGDPSDPKPDVPIEMPQQPPSSPPKGFYGSPGSNTSIILQWQIPDSDTWNGDLLGYTIFFKLTLYGDSTYQHRNVTSRFVTRYELTGLIIWQQYDIHIAAYNAKGIGVNSSSISVWTMEGHPTAPPNNVTMLRVNSTTIGVSWLPPNYDLLNGIIQGYRVEGRRLSSPTIDVVSIVPPDSTDPYGWQTTTLYDLGKYTEYSITALCFTIKGFGPQSHPVIIRTMEDVPDQVGSLKFDNIMDTSLRVKWTQPQHINGILTGYTLKYGKKNQPFTSLDFSNTTLTYTIYRLSPMTNYTIILYASTRIGDGPPRSADIESGVPPELPTAPSFLGVSSKEARSVQLQFVPGYNGKTSITLWIVEALEGEEQQWKEIYQVSAPQATSIKVQNLRPFTKYQLRLIAVNIVGRSGPSDHTREFETLQDAPDVPPGNVTVRALNATALRVSWTPLSKQDWNGAPRGYKIYYKTQDAPQFHIVPLDNGMNMDSYILVGLQEWIQYHVKMNAYNDVGVSPFSLVTVERTRESVPSAGPDGLRALPISSTSINVSWEDVPYYDRNGMILGYKVQYESSVENIPPSLQDVPGNGTKYVLLQSLRKYVMYDIRVLAYTRMGDGALSKQKISVRTFADVPGPPVIIWFPEVTYSLAKIVWESPLEPNGIIRKYMVSYYLKDSADQGAIANVELDASVREYTASTLIRENYYIFSVKAKTEMGWGEAANVTVYTMINRNPPDRPSEPLISQGQIMARSVTINWQPAGFDGYGPLRNYTVQYKRDTGVWTNFSATVPPESVSYTITGLRPNTRYSFRVAATNDIGMSDWSLQSAEVKTLQDKPEGAPINVKVVPVTMSSVRVTWEQPPSDTWNGNLLGYTVQYRQVDMSNDLEEIVVYPRHEITMSNLVKYVNYEFKILAFNPEGHGPQSTPVTVYVGEAAPTAPPQNIHTEAKNSTEILVTWQPPPPDTQNGELSGYKISYWLKSDMDGTAKQIIVRESHVVLTGLQIYSDYATTVQAYNLAGEGPKSDVKYQRTKQGVPTRPGALAFSNITLVSLNVSWSPPDKPNGVILTYELAYFLQHPVDVEGKLVKLTVNGTRRYVIIDGLEEDGTYNFSVSARTIIGAGEITSAFITTGPQPGSPGQPGKPDISKDDTSVTLTWIPGADGASPVYGYIIQEREELDTHWKDLLKKHSKEPSARVHFGNLSPDKSYQFRIIALNSVGMSSASESSDLMKTPPSALSIEQPEKPFHTEWWFLVIIALTGLIVILVIISLLCLVSRRSRNRKKKPTAAPTVPNPLEPPEPEEGGFHAFELNPSRRSFAGIRNGSVKNIYARSPPRPSPASVAYSDDDTTIKPPLDDNSSSLSDKPSDLGDSTEPSDEESEVDDYTPASPPPPPFGVNHYVNEPARQSWRHQNSHNAYAYTDSEAESSHYAMSLNAGQLMLNNTAGSRAPLPGFSSFV